MDAQFVLRVVGIAALAIAALFAVLAVQDYLSQDIRGVMDDLSGKTRARGVAGVRRSAASDRRRETTRRAAATPVVAAVAADDAGTTSEESQVALVGKSGSGMSPSARGEGGFGFEPSLDELETMVEPAEDELETMVEPAEDELETMVEPAEDELETMVEGAPDTGFRVTRRVVHMSSQQVIAASEEVLR